MTAQSRPNTANKTLTLNPSKGFTLIELLVTIAIIAIISVVAVALFGNVQSNARDGKRKAELESIANALEVSKTSSGYQPIANTNFGGNLMPGNTTIATATTFKWAIDPQNVPYVIDTTAGVSDPSGAALTAWVANASPTTAAGTPPTGSAWAAIASGATPTANSLQYKICTKLENGGTPLAFCRTNTQ